ncbi:MAG: 50S ribosomal protein L11 methyltransferase [Candidatus Helarchaeota archaeon]
MIRADKSPKFLSIKFLLNYHRILLMDKIRLDAYYNAIQNEIKGGEIVADLGSGSGILTFFALKAGALKVYSIEESEFLMKLAYRISKRNNLNSKIKFINKNSLLVNSNDVNEKVDLIITEIMGSFGLEENILNYIINFRDKFLKKNGQIIPNKLIICIVPYESEMLYNQCFKFHKWLYDQYNLDFEDFIIQTKNFAFVPDDYQSKLTEKNLLIKPIEFKTIDLLKTNENYFSEKIIIDFNNLKNERTIHGFCGFFKAILSEYPNKIILSNSPILPDTSFGQLYFPLFKPIKISNGDLLELNLKFNKPGTWTIECKKY